MELRGSVWDAAASARVGLGLLLAPLGIPHRADKHTAVSSAALQPVRVLHRPRKSKWRAVGL